jgi:hypothetical protein
MNPTSSSNAHPVSEADIIAFRGMGHCCEQHDSSGRSGGVIFCPVYTEMGLERNIISPGIISS